MKKKVYRSYGDDPLLLSVALLDPGGSHGDFLPPPTGVSSKSTDLHRSDEIFVNIFVKINRVLKRVNVPLKYKWNIPVIRRPSIICWSL